MSLQKQPAIFIGHGNPMNAITENLFRTAWLALGKSLTKPRAVLCISAHWETNGTFITTAAQPKTIHDFYGFPQALFNQQYPAPGSPDIAEEIITQISDHPILKDTQWGFDHGAWTVLASLFPQADVPVLQLSLDKNKSFAEHLALGKALSILRDQGILLLGSGNIVHNLRALAQQSEPHTWAVEFDGYIKNALLYQDDEALIDYQQAGSCADLAVPSLEHYLPLLYIAGARTDQDALSFFTEDFDLAALSMRSVILE